MKNGPYILIIAPENYPGKKYRARYAYEHHVVFWENTGQLCKEGHVIHHKNEDKHDNRWGNLEEISKADHASTHHKGNINPQVHGTYHSYQIWKCRCVECRKANAKHTQLNRLKYGRKKQAKKIPRNPNG